MLKLVGIRAIGTRCCEIQESTVRAFFMLGSTRPHSYADCQGKLPPSHLQYIISQMVAKNLAVYEPAKQTRSVLLYWRLPEDWAEVLHEWVRPNQTVTDLVYSR